MQQNTQESILNISDLQRLINLVKTHKESPDLDSRSKGLLANILGELRAAEHCSQIEVKKVSQEITEIIALWKTDPVIQAYLKQKEELEQKIRELKWETERTNWDD